jgi:biotin synthase
MRHFDDSLVPCAVPLSTLARRAATRHRSTQPIVDIPGSFSLTWAFLTGNMPPPVSMRRQTPRPNRHSYWKQRDMRMDHTLLGAIRHDWTVAEVESLFGMPFVDLLFHAQRVHRQHHEPSTVQMSTLLSIKTGACPEDCAYCPQSVRYDTGLERETLLDVSEVVTAARRAKDAGATRFCMGAAYRSPKPKQVAAIAEMIREVRALGMETCATLGMLTPAQADELKTAGLDYYNHNIDTSPEFYGEIITTRTFQDRLDTLAAVREAGLKVCCGGIVGMGETTSDRAKMLLTLANLPAHPESVPINELVQVPGTPLHGKPGVDPFDFVRTVAVARLLMPAAHVRLSAGREAMSDELQALCFMAGANSMFYGEKLLTTGNPDVERDQRLFTRLGLKPEENRATVHAHDCAHEPAREAVATA